MRSTFAMIAAIVGCAGGLILTPSPHRASADQLKQFGLRLHTYHDIHNELDPNSLELLIAQSGDELVGLLVTENDGIVEAVAVPTKDRDFVNIRLSSGETTLAYVVWSDDDDLLLMDADGGLALFVIL